MDATDAARAHESDPDHSRSCEDASHRGRSDAAGDSACGEIAWAELPRRSSRTVRARPRRARSVSAHRERRWLPASRPRLARRAPSRRPPRRREARGIRAPRWSSRGRRPADHRRARREPRPRAGSARSRLRRYRHRAELLDAARGCLERKVGPADDPARSERVSCAGRVENPRDGERLALVVAEGASARAVLEDPQRSRRANGRRRAPRPRSRTRRPAPARRTASRNTSTPLSRIALHDARSTLIRAPAARASSTARMAALRTGSTISA